MLKEKEVRERLGAALALLRRCRLCPRQCEVNRLAGERGLCQAGIQATVASVGPHFGEEPCLVGAGGSGAIFLAGCNLGCIFCQNEDISRGMVGQELDTPALAALMLQLESRGCANINFVTPTHVSPAILAAIVEARSGGLKVPIVWNSSGYEAVEVLRLLDGFVEIYMPDFKFSLSTSAERYCHAPDYPARACSAISEMRRQVGDLVVEGGLARRGLLVRHLVMPGAVQESREILDFLASLSPQTSVNVMGQYRPAGAVVRAKTRRKYADIARPAAPEEVSEVRGYARQLGLRLID